MKYSDRVADANKEFDLLGDKIAQSLVCRSTRAIFMEVYTIEALQPIFCCILEIFEQNGDARTLSLYRMATINERFNACIRCYYDQRSLVCLLSHEINEYLCHSFYAKTLDHEVQEDINRYLPKNMQIDAYISMVIYNLTTKIWDTIKPSPLKNTTYTRLNEIFVFMKDEPNTDRIEVPVRYTREWVNMYQLWPVTYGYGSLNQELYHISGDYPIELAKLINPTEEEIREKMRILLRKYNRRVSDKIDTEKQYTLITTHIGYTKEYETRRIEQNKMAIIDKIQKTAALWKGFNTTQM